MWEKETRYKLTLKKNLIFEFCQEAYKESSNFDVLFITKDKFSIPAHRIILALSSDFIKGFESQDCVQIMLPDYSKTIVQCFVKFLYSGEALVDLDERSDFISLCNEMMVNVPGLCNNPVEVSEEYISEEAVKLEPECEALQNCYVDGSQIAIEEPEEIELSLLVEMESQEREIEHKICKDTPPHNENSQQQYLDNLFPTPKTRIKSNIYGTTVSSYSLEINPKGVPKITPKLLEAIDAVQVQGMNTMEAARKYGIPKTTLYRKLQKIKRKRVR